MTRYTLAAALLFAMLPLAACDTTKAPGEGRADPILRENYPRIVALQDLDRYLAFSPADVQDAGGTKPLSISVPVRVKSDEDFHVQYRYEFFDKSGRPIRPEMEWRYLKMPARAQVFMEGAALDTHATDWRLVVRPSRMSE